MRIINIVAISVLAIAQAACGGGGGTTGDSTQASNAVPIANPGALQNVVAGMAVTLDGSASNDADGDSLTYAWTLTTKPVGSAAALAGATSAAPTFIADAAGTYVASLVVNDGKVSSTASTVMVTATTVNAAPVAHAGLAQNVATGQLVSLDGSASSDANGDALTYAWTLSSKPAGSAAALAWATSAAPGFIADAAGTYVASLVVNDGKVSSTASTVMVTATTVNAAPVAHAGSAQNVATGQLVSLDGSASSDANGDALTYAWTLSSKPAGSAAALAGATSAAPTFIADAAGTYVASLVVNDGKVGSTASTVLVIATTVNAAPVAHAGSGQNVATGQLVTLDGSASSDANSDPLTYSWTLTIAPIGSLAVLSSATSIRPTFTAVVGGVYGANLIVSDGKLNSGTSTVTIKVVTPISTSDCASCHTSTAARSHILIVAQGCDGCHSPGAMAFWHWY